MGINAHILPGDWVVTTGADTILDHQKPSDTSLGWGADGNDFTLLNEETSCLVLSVDSAGSNLKGHVFYVLTSSPVRFGWVWNHSVRPIIAQREVQA
jgi:hypothetical protein